MKSLIWSDNSFINCDCTQCQIEGNICIYLVLIFKFKETSSISTFDNIHDRVWMHGMANCARVQCSGFYSQSDRQASAALIGTYLLWCIFWRIIKGTTINVDLWARSADPTVGGTFAHSGGLCEGPHRWYSASNVTCEMDEVCPLTGVYLLVSWPGQSFVQGQRGQRHRTECCKPWKWQVSGGAGSQLRGDPAGDTGWTESGLLPRRTRSTEPQKPSREGWGKRRGFKNGPEEHDTDGREECR